MAKRILGFAFVAVAGCGGDTKSVLAPNSTSATLNALEALPTWHPVDLGVDPTADYTIAWAVSRHRHIAGQSNFGSQLLTFAQRVGGGRQYLTPLPSHIVASPTGINDAGLISGRSYLNGMSLPTPVFWDGEGRVGTIPGIPNGEAFDVSETGWIVGYAISFHGVRGFRWRRGTSPILLQGEFAASQTQAFAVNDVGIVVGSMGFPALWNQSGVMQALPVPTGAQSGIATDINNAGEVVGELRIAGVRRAFKWSRSQGLTLLPNPPGTVSSYATDIDGPGRVFGYATVKGRSFPKAYVWVDGSPIPLPQLYPDAYFRDVNACGVAVGHGTAPDGKPHAIMWLTEC